MRMLLWAAAAYLLLVAQSVLNEELARSFCQPNLLLLGALTVAAAWNGAGGVLWCAVFGLLSDCLSPHGLGLGVTAFTLLGSLRQWAQERGWLGNVPAVALFVLISAGLNELAASLLLSARSGLALDFSALWQSCCNTALGTAVIALVLNSLARLCKRSPAATTRDRTGMGNQWRMLTY